jgi:hypothetical protein
MVFVVAAPPAYVYNVPATHSCTLVPCGVPHHDESPAEPDHDYLEGSLWVQTVTGGPNELSPMPGGHPHDRTVSPFSEVGISA